MIRNHLKHSKKMKGYKIFLLAFILFMFSCINNDVKLPDKAFTDSLNNTNTQLDIPDSIINFYVDKLSETKEFSNIQKKYTQNQYGIKVLLYEDSFDTSNNHYYWFKVGYDDDYMFHTIEHFYIYPNKKLIFKYDPIDDTIKLISEW